MRKTNFFVLLIAFLFIIFSCKKEEGEGGTSRIFGKVYKITFPEDLSYGIDTCAANDEDVYIIYGDNEMYSDKFETNYNGLFEFNYLRKGTYTIFIYSNDTSGSDNDISIKKEIEITKNNQTIDAGIIYIYDGAAGKSFVTGRVFEINYLTDYTRILDTSAAKSEDVYLSVKGKDYFIDDIETHFDGTFIFNDLTLGDYYIYIYSNAISGSGNDTIVTKSFSIAKPNQIVNLGEIYIYKGNTGTSSISGKIKAVDYYYSDMSVKPVPHTEYYAAEEDVYIIYENSKMYFERVRTNHDGSFIFEGLINGTYIIYAYSKTTAIASGYKIETDTVEITKGNYKYYTREIEIRK